MPVSDVFGFFVFNAAGVPQSTSLIVTLRIDKSLVQSSGHPGASSWQICYASTHISRRSLTLPEPPRSAGSHLRRACCPTARAPRRRRAYRRATRTTPATLSSRSSRSGIPMGRVISAPDADTVAGDRLVGRRPGGRRPNGRPESTDVGLNRADLPELRRGEPGPVSALRLLRNGLVAAQSPQEVRKTVTVVFCDLKGSTALGDRLDSESLREVLALYFSAMKPVLERHGGTIEKYIGDAIMAVFGLPRMHEDDALRAVRAAAECARRSRSSTSHSAPGWGSRWRTGPGSTPARSSPANRRVPAPGHRRHGQRRRPPRAGRPGGEVLIGESTYRLVRDAVEVVPVEPLTLKGKPERVPAYRLLSVTEGATSTTPADPPLVGRRARDRRPGRRVPPLASPGRVPARHAVRRGRGRQVPADRGVRAECRRRGGGTQSRCLSYGDGITYWPLAEVFRQAAGIVPEDGEEDARAKLASCLGERLADATSRIESIMGLSEQQYGKDELFWAVRAVLQELARRRPLVVVFDDIHWAEPTFLDFIEQLLDASLGVPLLLVCASRHELLEDRPSFASGRRAASQIELGELSREPRAAWWCGTFSARRACLDRSGGGSSASPKATPCSSSRCSPC